MIGEHVRLHLYQRNEFPRATLYTLWRYVEEAGAYKQLFYAQPVQAESERGDLIEFVNYFTDSKRILYIAQSLKTNDVAGMVWFDDIQPGWKAAANIFMRRRYWGGASLEAARMGLRHIFDTLKVESIWAYTPWKHAITHAERAGMIRVALLPGFVRIDGAPRDIHVLRAMREDYS